MRARFITAGLLTVGAVAAAGAVAVPASAGPSPTKNVRVADYSYTPHKLTITKGTKVKWSWSKKNITAHNVTLVKGPKGIVKREWKSATGSRGIKFSRTFSKVGTYHFLCTIHSFMTMTVVVKR